MRRRFSCLTTLLCGAICAVLLEIPAAAAVDSTTEATGGADRIYVAGNPDWYPVEYYNPDTGCYEGLFPELLEQISEKTGLSFTYICAGEEDQRIRLAMNGQAELISGYDLEDSAQLSSDMTVGSLILTIPGDDGNTKACFVFTNIASDSLIHAVEDTLHSITPQEIAGITARFAMEHRAPPYPAWLIAVGSAVLVLLLAAVIFLAVKLRKSRNKDNLDVWIDPTTGIGNSAYFVKCFENDIPDRYRELYCVTYIGFDIARVNQYYGEAEADEQLRFAAGELSLSVRDNEIAARVSGGGFAVARPTSGEPEAGEWAEALLSRLNRFTEKYGKDYHPMFSAGLYMLQLSDKSCHTALFNARQGYDLAVSTGVSYVFSRTDRLNRESENLQLKKQILESIQNRQFKMFLQFYVRPDGSIAGAEALSRWEHPQRGLLHPSSYIGLMEAEKTIAELDFYIFEEVCRQLEGWEKQDWQLGLSCNFARITIDQEDFVPRLEQILALYAFERSRLTIEVTEDVMEGNKKIAFENMSLCKELGFRIALDDMGSGYTSFSDLRDYPIDIVKIDRSILSSAVTPQGIALLKGMISLAHDLQMQALCEGVETAAQADLLSKLECDYMQGYYFYRALPGKEAERLLNRGIQRK